MIRYQVVKIYLAFLMNISIFKTAYLTLIIKFVFYLKLI